MSAAAPALTTVSEHCVEFVLPDPDHQIAGVRLWQELRLPGDGLSFHRDHDRWVLRLPIPDVARMEYLYEVAWVDGGAGMQPDPTNPHRVSGAFGEKSCLQFPGYRPPAWLDEPALAGDLDAIAVHDTPVGTIEGLVWTPRHLHADMPAGWLLIHDGPEMADHAHVLQFVAAALHAGRIPPVRVALLAPGPRNLRYAANPDYADALVGCVLPALRRLAVAPQAVVLAGASLGALAALSAQWRHPGAFAGLFLQSGSFFTPATDPQESGFEYFREVVDFVATVHTTEHAAAAVAVAMTCGATEENIHCNRLMARHLSRLGLGADLVEARDMHNWTCWRDTFHPSLTRLLRQVWGNERHGGPDGT